MAASRSNVPEWIERLSAEARIMNEARMLRDEQELTPELTQAVIQRFRDYLKRAEKSEGWAARSMGMKASTLSQVLSGTYAADVEKFIRTIDKWVEQQILRESAPKPSGFVKTTIAEKIYAVAKWVQKINAIGVIHGPAGAGKTMTAMALRAETPGSVYIRITTAGQSKLSVLEALSQALRLTGMKLTTWHLHQQLVSFLRGTNRLIIVDEIHKLVERRKDEALHALRDLHDETECPMLWLGMSNIANYIQGGKTQYESLDQLSSRIRWFLDLREIAKQPDGSPRLHTIDDIRKMIAASKIRVTSDAEHYLQMLSNETGQGGLRTVYSLIQIASAYVKDKPITAVVLRDIRRQQFGARAADQIEQQMEIRAAISA